MAELTIPDEHKFALNTIRTMPEESLSGFITALEGSPGATPSVQGLTPAEAETVREVVSELYRVRTYFDTGVPEFASTLAKAFQQVESFPTDQVPDFRARLEKLLSIRSLSIVSKARSLKSEYERRFCSARILTDARPVYGDDPLGSPVATLIVHNLRISYHDDSPHLREVHFAMDGDDVVTLRALLDRADAKAKSLEAVFEAAKIRVVDP